MAILKHSSNKNASYTDAIQYLMFKYDVSVKQPILDDYGNLQLRDEFYMDGINCDPMTFDLECEQLNKTYHKNQSFDEVKMHQYILSFDPKDVTEHGLTGEKAQALGLEFAKKNFPGHQVIVVTHTDGSNKSGNVHVHIVLNSLRKYDVPEQHFMERECDHKAGYKHHLTNNLLEYLKMDLMELCERENLNQVDLLSPAAKKITHAEYKAMQKGQKKLDALNEEIRADGLIPAKTKYQTQKQYLRDAILNIAEKADTIEEFKLLLWEKYKIKLRDKRGRFSYLHPDREKAISERSLGTDYSKKELLPKIGKQLKQVIEPEYKRNPFAILTYPSNLRLVVDLQKCVKAQQNTAYARKVKISNLQQMANTLIFLQENNIGSLSQLEQEYKTVSANINQLYKQKEDLQTELAKLNKQIHYLGQYHVNKKYFSAMLRSDNKAEYQKQHLDKIEKYEEARRFLKMEFSETEADFPDLKTIKEQRNISFSKSIELSNQIHWNNEQKKKLSIALGNAKLLLSKEKYRLTR